MPNSNIFKNDLLIKYLPLRNLAHYLRVFKSIHVLFKVRNANNHLFVNQTNFKYHNNSNY